jgi:Zn-dependent M16 (insulinase) family peptidase
MKNKTQQETWNVFPRTPSSSEIKHSAVIYNRMVGTVTAVESIWERFHEQ